MTWPRRIRPPHIFAIHTSPRGFRTHVVYRQQAGDGYGGSFPHITFGCDGGNSPEALRFGDRSMWESALSGGTACAKCAECIGERIDDPMLTR